MKPLPVLTEEDWCIWLRLRVGQFDSRDDDSWLEVVDAYEASDRHDAALMFHAQRNKPLLSRVIRTDDLSIVNLRGVSGRGSMTLTGPWPPVLPDITYFA
jgi:hypothetical protein